MERTAPGSTGTTDRERRERLEQLQAEVRQAKAQLADVEKGGRAAVASLEVAVAQARARLEAERGRAPELQKALETAEAEVASLQDAYDAVAVKQLGDHLSEGFANMMRAEQDPGEKGNGPDLGVILLVIPLIGVGGLLLALMLQGLFK